MEITSPKKKKISTPIPLLKGVNKVFKNKYKTDETTYHTKVVTDIIFNEKTRLVALFKDYLILDDSSEFLRRFYNKGESNTRLNKIITFYEAYSKIFPNYIIIPESKCLYKNIRRKQKMIDAFNQIKMEEEENKKNLGTHNLNGLVQKKKPSEKFFDTEIRQSILRYQPSFNHHNSSVMNSSVISLDKIHNNSVSISLNLNKNIYENEESILSVEQILNVMDKKPAVGKSNKRGTNNLASEAILKTTETLSTVEEDGGNNDNDPKKKLKTILAESISKMKNISGKYINVHINPNGVKKENVNEKEKEKDKPIMKKLPLKKLKLNSNDIVSPSCTLSTTTPKVLITGEAKKTEISSLVTSPHTDRKKIATHRVSSSIPEGLCNTLKIINNYPNIIIPNSSTHVSINQNYYNYGSGDSMGTRIIIEQLDSKTERVSKNKKKEKEKDNYNSNSNTNSNSISPPKKMQRKNTFTKANPFASPKSVASTFSNTNRIKVKSQTLKSSSNNSNTYTITESNSLTNKNSTQQIYSKVLKIFNDNNSKNDNKKYVGVGYKTIENLKKMKTTRKININTKTEKKQEEVTKSKPEKDTYEALATEREMGTKSRMETKETVRSIIIY